MGKKSRPKKRQQQKQQQSSQLQPPQPNGSTTTSDLPKGPAILQRIRHADPKVRHAALSALTNNTTLSSSSSSSSSKKVNTSLIQAIREQLVDRDLNCAIAAAGCLANYASSLSSPSSSSSSLDDNNDEEPSQLHTLSAGWLVLVVGRLKDCVNRIRPPPPPQLHHISKQDLLWLELTERCLTCMVYLIENNAMAMDRLTAASATADLRRDCMAVVTELLQRTANREKGTSSSSMETTTISKPDAAAAAAAAGETHQQQEIADANQRIAVIQMLCCRFFHSSWDDNSALLQPWMQEQPETSQLAIQLLQSILVVLPDDSTTTTTSTTPGATMTGSISATDTRMTCCLHAVGAWLSVWALMQNNGAPETTAVLDSCLGILHQPLASWHDDTRRKQVLQLCAAHNNQLKEQTDYDMEQDILKKQARKNEPARNIARRHQQKNGVEGHDDGDVDMDGDADKKKKGKSANEEEGEDHNDDAAMDEDDEENSDWETMCRQWHESTRPIQLALEITANLTSLPSMDSDDDGDVCMDQPAGTMDALLVQLLKHHNIPVCFIDLLHQLSLFSTSLPVDAPDLVKETISELQIKTAVCLGHCLTNIPDWVPPGNLWQLLKDAWSNAVDTAAREALGSTMLLTLQQQQDGVTDNVTPTDDLNFLLQIVSNKTLASPIALRDTVTMLGLLLCRNPHHSAEINHKVVQSLIQASNNDDNVHVMVLSEVLRVLMDIYGEDDCHPAVFESLQVLSHFQRSLPKLKQRINLERKANPEDVEQWKETVMNAARFIQYKKGHAEE